jgi:hypothetical protein
MPPAFQFEPACVADRRGERHARLDANGPAWLLTDRLGSIRVVTDDAGSVISTMDYDAYGNLIADTLLSVVGPIATPAIATMTRPASTMPTPRADITPPTLAGGSRKTPRALPPATPTSTATSATTPSTPATSTVYNLSLSPNCFDLRRLAPPSILASSRMNCDANSSWPRH